MDRYTKAVLTVIAVALVVIGFRLSVQTVAAQAGEPMKVQICDAAGQCAGTLRLGADTLAGNLVGLRVITP